MRRIFGAGFALSCVLVMTVAAVPSPDRAAFVSFARSFSDASRLQPALDPEIFVPAPQATAGIGPESIPHVAGVRNARLADDKDRFVAAADGAELGFSLASWLAAVGTIDAQPTDDGQVRLLMRFSSLLSGSKYSLFVRHPMPLGTFVALGDFAAAFDGSATMDVKAPLESGDAVVLVYHSDGRPHGASPGNLGLDAHIQLIWQAPSP